MKKQTESGKRYGNTKEEIQIIIDYLHGKYSIQESEYEISTVPSYPTFGSDIEDIFLGWIKSVDDSFFFGFAGWLSNSVKSLFGAEVNDWERLQENPYYNMGYNAGSIANTIYGLYNLGKGLTQISASEGTVFVSNTG